MRSFRKLSAALIVVVALGLVGGAGFYLVRTQAETRSAILDGFDERGKLAAGLIGDNLRASDQRTREYANTAFAGPVAGLDAALAGSVNASTPWLVVLDSSGRGLGAAPEARLGMAPALRADPAFGLALRTGWIAFGDFVTDKGVSIVYAFQPFRVAGDTRMLVVPTDTAGLDVLLRGALNVSSGHSYITDSKGNVLVGSGGAVIGAPIPDRGVAGAAARTSRGLVENQYFASYPVAGSNWRVTATISYGDLLKPVRAAERTAWLIFAGFACAVVLILVVGAATLASSARLARARQHDPLTGLANRSLLHERAENAIAHRRPFAVLFLDLDGFKPVNDTFGHRAGDELLRQVAQRLVAATRPEDYVSRFGGDEFVVLCRGLNDGEQDAFAVAERVQLHLSEQYRIDGNTVRIGVSIGIATPTSFEDDAELVIHRADLALYHAKNTGKNRITKFVPEMADDHA